MDVFAALADPVRRGLIGQLGSGPARVVDLAEEGGVTTLTFAQAMRDPDVAENVGPGWDYYLDRLAAAETGGDADSVRWDDYYPALADHYRSQFA